MMTFYMDTKNHLFPTGPLLAYAVDRNDVDEDCAIRDCYP